MSVVAKMVDGTIQFHPDSHADKALAEYLCDLAKKARAHGLAKSAPAGRLLVEQAAEWEERSRDTRLDPEVRAYLVQKARDARIEAARLG